MIGKSPVNIIQELLAIHTTRRDAYSKIKQETNDEQLKNKLNAAIVQSEQFIEELMSELSQFGDAVSGDVDRDNIFINTWKNSIDTVETMDKEELTNIVQNMEDSLQRYYKEFIDLPLEFSESMKEMLQRQANELG